MVKAAILGIGTVGSGTAEVLTKNKDVITRRAGQEIELAYILCRKARPATLLRKNRP
jgi:homoserine dehydrogenase